MASIAFDSQEEFRSAKPPISVHPAFPAIVALWFSALLGLGSLVLPAALLDGFVSATGLASMLPVLSPPLGFGARALIALVAALVGVILGVALARRVANSHAPKPESRISKLAGGSRRPVSVHEEIGGDGVTNGEGLPINRRRALAIAEDERPSDFLYVAPMPGEDPYGPAPAQAFEELPEDVEPLELSEAIDNDADPAFAGCADKEPDEDYDMAERQEFRPVSPFEGFDEPEGELADGDAAPEADERHLRNNAAGRRGMEPLLFSAPSLARQVPQAFVQVALAMRQSDDLSPAPGPDEFEEEYAAFEDETDQPALQEAEAAPFHGDWASAPLETLGLVQLVQRLGSTIEKRREWAAQLAAAPVAVPSPAFAGVEAAPAEEAAEAMAAFFGSPSAPAIEEPAEAPVAEGASSPLVLPRAILPGSFANEDDEDDGDMPDFSLPLRRPAATAPSFAGYEKPESDEEAGDESEESYGSLIDLNNPFAAPKNDFVRIDEPEPDTGEAPPAVVFPGQEQPKVLVDPEEAGQRLFDPPGAASKSASQPLPAEADAALRAALATLQRMSGAA